MSVVVILSLFIKNLTKHAAFCSVFIFGETNERETDCTPSSNGLGTNILEVGKIQLHHFHVQEYIQC